MEVLGALKHDMLPILQRKRLAMCHSTARDRVSLHVSSMSSDSSVQQLFGNFPPDSVTVYKLMNSSANLREATQRFVVQI